MTSSSANLQLQLKSILVLTDFSAAANAGLAYGAELARNFGATLHVANLVWLAPYMMEPSVAGAAFDWMLQVGADQLRAIDQADDLRSIPHRVHLEKGDLEQGLDGLVTRLRVDLIVLGCNGRHGVDKFFLGSNAEHILRRAVCPVLTLGPAAWQTHAPRRFHSILAATDFSATARAAQGYAVSLAEVCDASVCFLHVLPAAGEISAAARSEALTRLRGQLPLDPASAAARTCIVQSGPPAASILAQASTLGADLIVLGAHRTRMLGDRTGWATAYRVICEAPCPVLTVRN